MKYLQVRPAKDLDEESRQEVAAIADIIRVFWCRDKGAIYLDGSPRYRCPMCEFFGDKGRCMLKAFIIARRGTDDGMLEDDGWAPKLNDASEEIASEE